MPQSHNEQPNTDVSAGLLRLAQQAQRLKRIPRQGWLDRGVSPLETESVADHSMGVALLAWISALEAQSAGAELDPVRVLMLALIHDLPEAEIGDWTPYTAEDVNAQAVAGEREAFLNMRQTRSPERTAAKRAAEQVMIDQLSYMLGSDTGTTLASLWQELVDGETREAQFVKQVDRLETFLQSRAYAADDPTRPMESFKTEASAEIIDPLLASVRDRALANEDER